MILGIYSASGGGRIAFELESDINHVENRWDSYIFIDDTKPNGSQLRGYPIYSFQRVCEKYSSDEIEIIIAVGEPSDRKIIYDKVKTTNYKLATLIHPSAHVSDKSKIGDGVIIHYNACILCDAIIEDNVIIQPFASVGHDDYISKHCAISGHSDIAGYVNIGYCSYIGLNVCVREHVNIGKNVIVSAGSAVLKDLPDSVIAQGNPARPIIRRTDERVFKKISGVNC